jgi:hypothetical protein
MEVPGLFAAALLALCIGCAGALGIIVFRQLVSARLTLLIGCVGFLWSQWAGWTGAGNLASLVCISLHLPARPLLARGRTRSHRIFWRFQAYRSGGRRPGAIPANSGPAVRSSDKLSLDGGDCARSAGVHGPAFAESTIKTRPRPSLPTRRAFFQNEANAGCAGEPQCGSAGSQSRVARRNEASGVRAQWSLAARLTEVVETRYR